MKNKAALRQAMLARRSEMAPETRQAACGYLCEKLLSVPRPEGAVVGAYFPINHEVDIIQAVESLLEDKIPVCMPSITKPESSLQFMRYDKDTPIRKGPFGTTEPAGGEMLIPDVLWVPMLAFDRRGYRLGYGGGYYDRTIPELKTIKPSLQTIGIATSFQEVDELPVEAHDARLDMIVTEKEIIRG